MTFDEYERAAIMALIDKRLHQIHRANQAQGSYRYLCMVEGEPIYCHKPFGVVLRDLEQEPDL